MTETIVEQRDEALESARWDLQPLVEGRGAEGVVDLLDEAQVLADAFAERYRGRVADLDAGEMAAAMRELEQISDKVGRAASYAALDFSVDTQDPARGALMQQAQERGAAIQTALLFFDLEWNQADDAHAEAVLASDELAFCRHYLRTIRRYRPHQLSEAEERIATELDVTGRSAFKRLFTEQVGALTVELLEEGEVPLMQALSLLQGPDREKRRTAAEGVTESLQPGLRTRAFIMNTLLADKATKDRLRSYEHWLASRNLANEASDESVQALVDAVVSRYELARRWYRLKAKLLGLDRLAFYDRMAPVSDVEQPMPYLDARDLVLDCYRSFSPEMGDVAAEFFEGAYIDAPPEPGKRGGAFCSYTVPSAHPYVLLNHTGRMGDALTMAHELGHGVHAALARPRGIFEFTTPLTVAETASIVGETIVLERLLGQAPDAATRLSLLAESLDGLVAAVFRQIAMNRFEHRVHTARREEGELAVEQINATWLETQADLLGDSVEPSDDYGTWWSYVPHFVDTPGYVYAYAYGNLLALSVYRRYEEEGMAFVPSYLDLLRAGGSMPPEDLGRIVGVDLTDPGFWSSGLDLIERQLEAAEQAAAEASRI
jgi:oligoendopeptidase F